MSSKIVLYGANGYTGVLATELVAKNPSYSWFKDKLVLAGRTESKIKPLAEKYGLPYRVFNLNQDKEVDEGLRGVKVVIHMAGPFIRTCEPMLLGCIRNKVHYMDITGEQDAFAIVFEKYKKEIASAGILAVPGVGFDVVPTDCLASMLKDELPGATHLELAFSMGSKNPKVRAGTASRGTTLTAFESIVSGVKPRTRIDGKMTEVGINYKSRYVTFPLNGKKYVSFIPWGDVYTAYFSTRIPNIDTYIPSHPILATLSYYLLPIGQLLLLFVPFLKNAIISLIDKFVTGPTAEERKEGYMDVWGQVRDAKTNQYVTGSVTVPEGYTFTALASLETALRVYEGRTKVKAGACTPSMAFGKDLVKGIDGVTVHEFTQWKGKPAQK
ncbi:Saccharopine dehydrogenase-domain-containing protein [Paraphysoderma sedebokerense]|nr:Saccharopine dehydrogenase-domain-containing protein [Paraphysoderma sedebokerense]